MDTIELKNKIEEIISNHCGWSVIDDTMIDELVGLLGDKKELSNKPVKGICVDGGTEGNPGPCFYRGGIHKVFLLQDQLHHLIIHLGISLNNGI